jgi:hypothetical protein
MRTNNRLLLRISYVKGRLQENTGLRNVYLLDEDFMHIIHLYTERKLMYHGQFRGDRWIPHKARGGLLVAWTH